MDPERRGNFLTRALGIDKGRETYNHLFRKGIPRGWAVTGGVIESLQYFLLPASGKFYVGILHRDEREPNNLKAMLGLLSLGADVTSEYALLIGSVHPEWLLAKLAYNVVVELGDDALRSVRGRFHSSSGNGAAVV